MKEESYLYDLNRESPDDIKLSISSAEMLTGISKKNTSRLKANRFIQTPSLIVLKI